MINHYIYNQKKIHTIIRNKTVFKGEKKREERRRGGGRGLSLISQQTLLVVAFAKGEHA